MARSPSTGRAEAAAALAPEPEARFVNAYNRLQAAAAKSSKALPIPEIVVIGGQSDGKSSLLEAFLGFRFNLRGIEMSTRRPLILQMVNEPTAAEPRFQFKEDSGDYGDPIAYQPTAIADLIKQRTESHLQKIQAVVSSEPIITRVEYAHCSNLTVIDTPGLVRKAQFGEPENTPDDIESMVKSLAEPSHRIILFLQQSSFEWCISPWLDMLKTIDPNFKRTIIVISKFDNRLKEFVAGSDVNKYLSATGYLNGNTHVFFVALPKVNGTISNEQFWKKSHQVDGTISNEQFRKMIHEVDDYVLGALRKMEGGFDEDKYGSYIGFRCLQKYLHSELQKRYREAAPGIQKSLEQMCTKHTEHLTTLDSRIEALKSASPSRFRTAAMVYTTSLCEHLIALFDGHADPALQILGKTTEEEQIASGIVNWPGIEQPIKPPNSGLKLYGAAAFVRLMAEFRCAAELMQCPHVSQGKVERMLHGLAGSNWLTKAAAEIAREAARSCFAPLIDTACDRLAFVLRSLFDLPMERNCNPNKGSQYHHNVEDMNDYISFVAALQYSYYEFVKELSNQCKQEVHRRLDLVTSYILSDLGADDMCSKSGSAYSAKCKICGQYFGKMINTLIEINIPSALESGFLTPWRKGLYLELSVKLFAVTDDKLIQIFNSKGAVDYFWNKRQSLLEHQKILQSCLDEFKNIPWDL